MKKIIKLVIEANIKFCHLLVSRYPNFFGASTYSADLSRDIDAHIRSRRPSQIVEVGGIDRPLIKRSVNYKYIGIDIEEKQSCYEIYDEFYVQSIEQELEVEADLIISTTLLEHVPNNLLSFRVMYDAMKKDAVMFHYVPSKFHFYSIILRLVGPKLQKIIIKYLRPHAVAVTGYPAFFDNCSPTEMYKLGSKIGFSEIKITPYYRATDYFSFFVPLFVLVAVFENIFERLEMKTFASGFIFRASK